MSKRVIKSQLEAAEYHRLPEVSVHQLGAFATCPARYKWDTEHPKEQTDAMWWGEVVHTAVLEPELWDSTIAVPPHSFDRRTKAGKELAAEFERESAGKIVLAPEDADQVRRMADAVRKHPAAGFLLELPGRREASYTWTDPATGLECKTRPDWHSGDRRIVVDVKTTRDASRVEFAKSIANLDYHVQAAWNQDAIGAEQFITIAVENVRPFAVAVYPASGGMIAAGQRRIEAAMTLLAECWKSGRWPGYGDLVQEPIELPGWCRD